MEKENIATWTQLNSIFGKDIQREYAEEAKADNLLENFSDKELKEECVARAMEVGSAIDLRGFDTLFESDADNSKVSEEKWKILEQIAHEIVTENVIDHWKVGNVQNRYDDVLSMNDTYQKFVGDEKISLDKNMAERIFNNNNALYLSSALKMQILKANSPETPNWAQTEGFLIVPGDEEHDHAPDEIANFLNQNRENFAEPRFTDDQVEVISYYLRNNDYALVADQKGNMYISDFSEDFDGTKELFTNKDLIQFTQELMEKENGFNEEYENRKKVMQPQFDYFKKRQEQLDFEITETFNTLEVDGTRAKELINTGANVKNALYAASTDAFLGTNLRWLIENMPEEKWSEIKKDKTFCEQILKEAESSIMNDHEFTINPTLELAEKLEMSEHAINYCKNVLSKEVEKASPKYQADFWKSLNDFEERVSEQNKNPQNVTEEIPIEHSTLNAMQGAALARLAEKAYGAYQLDWMKERDYTLDDLIGDMQFANEQRMDEGEEPLDVDDLYKNFMAEGLNGEMFASLDEFKDNEFLDKSIVKNLMSEKDFESYESMIGGLLKEKGIEVKTEPTENKDNNLSEKLEEANKKIAELTKENEKLILQNAEKSTLLYEKNTFEINGVKRICEHGVMQGFINSVKLNDTLLDKNQQLADENDRLQMQLKKQNKGIVR